VREDLRAARVPRALSSPHAVAWGRCAQAPSVARASSLPVTYARIPRPAPLSRAFLRMTRARNPR